MNQQRPRHPAARRQRPRTRSAAGRVILHRGDRLPVFATEEEERAFWDTHTPSEARLAGAQPFAPGEMPPVRSRRRAPRVTIALAPEQAALVRSLRGRVMARVEQGQLRLLPAAGRMPRHRVERRR